MPLVWLIVICFVAAANPALLVLGLALGLLSIPMRRAGKVQQAGINATFGGSSMVDAAILKGRRSL